MAYKLIPTITPYPRMPMVKDVNDDFRVIKGDGDGGVVAGYAGSVYDVWREATDITTGAGGNISGYSVAVPAGYLYVAQSIVAFHDDTVARDLMIRVYSSATPYHLARDIALAPGMLLRTYNDIVMKEGEKIHIYGIAMAASKNLSIRINGYKVLL